MAELSGDYSCDDDVIHLTLSVSGSVLTMTFHSMGDVSSVYHQHGLVWRTGGSVGRDYRYELGYLGLPEFTFFITKDMHFFLNYAFYYDEARGQMIAGAEIIGYLPPLHLSGTCKRTPLERKQIEAQAARVKACEDRFKNMKTPDGYWDNGWEGLDCPKNPDAMPRIWPAPDYLCDDGEAPSYPRERLPKRCAALGRK